MDNSNLFNDYDDEEDDEYDDDEDDLTAEENDMLLNELKSKFSIISEDSKKEFLAKMTAKFGAAVVGNLTAQLQTKLPILPVPMQYLSYSDTDGGYRSLGVGMLYRKDLQHPFKYLSEFQNEKYVGVSDIRVYLVPNTPNRYMDMSLEHKDVVYTGITTEGEVMEVNGTYHMLFNDKIQLYFTAYIEDGKFYMKRQNGEYEYLQL